MNPCVARQFGPGHHLHGVVRPAVDEVSADLVVLNPEVPAPKIAAVVQAGSGAGAAFWVLFN